MMQKMHATSQFFTLLEQFVEAQLFLLQVYYLLALFSSWNSKQKSLFRWHWKCKEEVTEFDCIVLRRFLVALGPHKLMLGEQNSDTQRQINYQPSCILSSFVSLWTSVFFTLLRKKLEKIFFFVVLSDKLGEKKFLDMEFVWQRVNCSSYKNVFPNQYVSF